MSESNREEDYKLLAEKWEEEYIELAQKYEELLNGLPQHNFSKAGTYPEWVIDEVNRNVFIKLDTQDDVMDILIRSEVYGYGVQDLANEIRDYLGITKEMEEEYEENKRSLGINTIKENYDKFMEDSE